MLLFRSYSQVFCPGCLFLLALIIWYRDTGQNAFAITLHSRSLIRIITGRILDSQGCKNSSCGHRRLWSNCADAQAEFVSSLDAQSEGMFSHVAFICFKYTHKYGVSSIDNHINIPMAFLLPFFPKFSQFKAPYSSKIDIFFIQERLNKLIYTSVLHWVRITSVLRFIKHIFITNLQSIPPLLKHIFVTFLPSREKQINSFLLVTVGDTD